MPKYDDVKANEGLPPEDTAQKASFGFIGLFVGAGIILAILIFVFQDVIRSGGHALAQLGYAPEQVIMNSLLAIVVGGIQAWIFKDRIKARIPLFVSFSLLGGFIAGLVGGSLMSAGLLQPFVVGFINGAISGGISSYSQNRVMKNSKYAQQWFLYNLISWAVIFSIGWGIGWRPSNMVALAIAALFLVIASGVSLVVFLNRNPQIEFS